MRNFSYGSVEDEDNTGTDRMSLICGNSAVNHVMDDAKFSVKRLHKFTTKWVRVQLRQ